MIYGRLNNLLLSFTGLRGRGGGVRFTINGIVLRSCRRRIISSMLTEIIMVTLQHTFPM